ncbi:NAD(+)/NADH kinase [Candidatus Chlorohelix sp.]|uniref:ATP-NAD kinase family protein n=1 Tax=Candidatus Chlorohelix sp. TaxID=3139201 RepID=UPI003068BBE3
MTKVGIIANPSSGKDIRRIVAEAWVVSNQEKVAIVRRLLRGLEAAGVEEVLFMPEPRGLCMEALNTLGSTALIGKVVDVYVTGKQEDSTRAAAKMVEDGVNCIITLGGDGTNRAVFKGCGSKAPLLPISTGTNNVFPEFQEGTTAGFAAGLLACGVINRDEACWRSKVLLVKKEGQVIDLALIDLALTIDSFIGARAVWDSVNLRELLLTRAQPWSIGLSAIGGAIHPVFTTDTFGLHISIGPGKEVLAPITPGIFSKVSVSRVQRFNLGDDYPLVIEQQMTLAFDGERDLVARPGETLIIQLSPDGPWVLDPTRALTAAIGKTAPKIFEE